PLHGDAQVRGQHRPQDAPLGDVSGPSVQPGVVSGGLAPLVHLRPFRISAVARRTNARGIRCANQAITLNRRDGTDLVRPASTSSRQSATSRSAASHRNDGIAEVRIFARPWNSVRTHPGINVITCTPLPSSSRLWLSE